MEAAGSQPGLLSRLEPQGLEDTITNVTVIGLELSEYKKEEGLSLLGG